MKTCSRVARLAFVFGLLLLWPLASTADVIRDGHRDRPYRPLNPNHAPKPDPAPDPAPAPAPAEKACGMGMGLVVLGLGILAAWRLSKTPPAARPAEV